MAASLFVLSEAQWQCRVTDLAEALGWTVVHVRRTPTGRTTTKWTTATSIAGWPDLVLIHRHHGIAFSELKRDRGRVSAVQTGFLAVLDAAMCAMGCPDRVHVWRPADEPAVEEFLRHGPGER